jgi:hypothetical protein
MARRAGSDPLTQSESAEHRWNAARRRTLEVARAALGRHAPADESSEDETRWPSLPADVDSDAGEAPRHVAATPESDDETRWPPPPVVDVDSDSESDDPLVIPGTPQHNVGDQGYSSVPESISDEEIDQEREQAEVVRRVEDSWRECPPRGDVWASRATNLASAAARSPPLWDGPPPGSPRRAQPKRALSPPTTAHTTRQAARPRRHSPKSRTPRATAHPLSPPRTSPRPPQPVSDSDSSSEDDDRSEGGASPGASEDEEATETSDSARETDAERGRRGRREARSGRRENANYRRQMEEFEAKKRYYHELEQRNEQRRQEWDEEGHPAQYRPEPWEHYPGGHPYVEEVYEIAPEYVRFSEDLLRGANNKIFLCSTPEQRTLLREIDYMSALDSVHSWWVSRQHLKNARATVQAIEERSLRRMPPMPSTQTIFRLPGEARGELLLRPTPTAVMHFAGSQTALVATSPGFIRQKHGEAFSMFSRPMEHLWAVVQALEGITPMVPHFPLILHRSIDQAGFDIDLRNPEHTPPRLKRSGRLVPWTFFEYIHKGTTLYAWFKQHAWRKNGDELVSMVLNLMLGLHMAQKQCQYVNGNLRVKNILVGSARAGVNAHRDAAEPTHAAFVYLHGPRRITVVTDAFPVIHRHSKASVFDRHMDPTADVDAFLRSLLDAQRSSTGFPSLSFLDRFFEPLRAGEASAGSEPLAVAEHILETVHPPRTRHTEPGFFTVSEDADNGYFALRDSIVNVEF